MAFDEDDEEMPTSANLCQVFTSPSQALAILP